jgi:1,4-alpha-glucan branching enzyme
VNQGYLSLVLHAHLPFVRHVADPRPQRDDWFLQALVECYLPLFQSWHRLLAERVPFRLTLSISPTLLSMFTDPYLRERAGTHLDQLAGLAGEELVRTRGHRELHAVAQMYADRFAEMRKFYLDRWDGDVVECLRPLVDGGGVELITTCATHGFLPALSADDNAVRAQIQVALDMYDKVWGGRPKGFWIPECGYYPGLDAELEKQGIRYFIAGTQGVLKGRPSPRYGVFAPVYCPTGVAVFARDPAASEQVWSSFLGYPGDHDYREFYRDIGYDLDEKYLAPYLPSDGARRDTGFKYHRITGHGVHKDVYVREWAMHKAGLHAGHFLHERLNQLSRLGMPHGRRPILVAPFDAELFGHWWFEGPEWLDMLVRKIAFDQNRLRLITPGDYLDRFPTNQVVEINPSTWGRHDDSGVWVNRSNDYIYRHLHWAAGRIREIAARATDARTLLHRAEKQAARELLLAQASDWPFMMENRNTAPYGHKRFRQHMLNFTDLYGQIRNGRIEKERLYQLEREDNVFPEIQLTHFM